MIPHEHWSGGGTFRQDLCRQIPTKCCYLVPPALIRVLRKRQPLGASCYEEHQPKQKEIDMKSGRLIISCVIVLLLLAACSPSDAQIASVPASEIDTYL